MPSPSLSLTHLVIKCNNLTNGRAHYIRPPVTAVTLFSPTYLRASPVYKSMSLVKAPDPGQLRVFSSRTYIFGHVSCSEVWQRKTKKKDKQKWRRRIYTSCVLYFLILHSFIHSSTPFPPPFLSSKSTLRILKFVLLRQ